MTRIEEARAAIERGAKWADRYRPGWHKPEVVDGERLEMASGFYRPRDLMSCGCIGAQIDAADTGGRGEYENFLETYHLEECQTGFLGFVPPEDCDTKMMVLWETGFPANAWRQEIAKRLDP